MQMAAATSHETAIWSSQSPPGVERQPASWLLPLRRRSPRDSGFPREATGVWAPNGYPAPRLRGAHGAIDVAGVPQ
jgi:hypothetical protein